MKKIKQLAEKAAGPLENWQSKYERDAFIRGFIEALKFKI